MILDFLDQVEAVFQFRDIAARMGEDHFLELLIGFRIADQAGKGCNPGAGRKHIKTFPRCERIEDERACGLLAHQHLVARLDRLQMRCQRTIGHLDREKLQFLIPGGACNRIGAIDRLFTDHQPDHGEFARTKTEAVRTRHAKAEQAVRIVGHTQYRLGINAVGNGNGRGLDLCRSVHSLSRPIRLVLSVGRCVLALPAVRPETSTKSRASHDLLKNLAPVYPDFLDPRQSIWITLRGPHDAYPNRRQL